MSRRNRTRSSRGTVVKARAPRIPAGGVTFSPEQLNALLALQRGQSGAVPMTRPPRWSTDPFGPGFPLPPAAINITRPDTGRAEPRLYEYDVGTNLQLYSKTHVPWKTLTEAADMPLFRKCIERRKGICDLGFTVTLDEKAVAREGALTKQADKDVEKAMRAKYMPDIVRVSDWLEHPDRQNRMDWRTWTSALMENRLVYDATVIYPQYSYSGDLLAFRVIDGKTVKPLQDEYGAIPAPPYPAYQQILYAFPRGEFTATPGPDGSVPGFPADQLVYKRTIYRPTTPYGMSAVEIALLDGMLWLRRMGWLQAEYTHGVSGAMLETSPETDWNVRQWEEWSRALNDHLSGNTAERLQWDLLPPGVKAVLPPEVAERYKPDMDMFLIKLIAGDFGLTATELGFPEVGSLGASFHEGEEDVLNRVTRRPDSAWVAGIATELCTDHLGMPPVLQVQILGLESEDEAAADATALAQVQSGRMTLNQDNERRGMPAYDFAEADMPMLMLSRGVVFLEGASEQEAPGTLIEPAHAPPGGGPAGVPGDQQDGGQGDDGPPGGEATPAAKSAEKLALKRWVARHPDPSRPFVCKALTASDVPALAGDPRVVFKDADDQGKVPAGTGPAGSGTRSW